MFQGKYFYKLIGFVGLLIILSGQTYASNQRRCILLPIPDLEGSNVSFRVFQEVEKYLKGSDWCYFRSNSGIIDILGNYHKNIKSYLRKDSVLKLIADKTNSGSLIRIDIENTAKGYEIFMSILGANGTDLYFEEKQRVESEDPFVVAQTAKNWLEVYEATIPYDGQVLGVLGDNFTMDMGRASGINPGNDVKVIRPTMKKRHPLLKSIVDWDTKSIGTGAIFHVSEFQGQGRIKTYDGNQKVQIGDWVRVDKRSRRGMRQFDDKFLEKKDAFSFGKLGMVSFYGLLGKGATTILDNQIETSKLSGFSKGLGVKAEIWATRNVFVSLELARRFTTQSRETGSPNVSELSAPSSYTIFKGGYKYLPMGFFFGPQVDIFVGLANFYYNPENFVNEGYVESSFKGFQIGTRGSIPLERELRLYAELSLMLSPDYEETFNVYGEEDSTSNYHLEFGANYNFAPNMTVDGAFGYTSSKATFKNPTEEVNFSDSEFKVGASFIF